MTKGKKRLITWTIVLVCIGIVIGLFLRMWPSSKDISESTVFQAEQVEEQAKYMISLLDAGEYATMREYETPDMQATLSNTAINQAKAAVADEFGAFVAYGSIEMSEMTQGSKTYAFVQMVVTYENTDVTYSLTFDEDMKLAGIYMK